MNAGVISNVTESLFIYNNSGLSFDELLDQNFTLVFEPVFSRQELPEIAQVMCEGDAFCLYDIAATGDTIYYWVDYFRWRTGAGDDHKQLTARYGSHPIILSFIMFYN